MRKRITSTNFNLTPEIKTYLEEKLVGSISKFLSKKDLNTAIIEIDLGVPSKHHRKGEIYRCEVNLTLDGRLMRAEETGVSMTEAIDKVKDEIERQTRKTKEKERTKFLRGARSLAKKFKLSKWSRFR